MPRDAKAIARSVARVERLRADIAEYGCEEAQAFLDDLLTDARHYADAHDVDFELAVDRSGMHHLAEGHGIEP